MDKHTDTFIATIEQRAIQNGLRPEEFRGRIESVLKDIPDPARALRNFIRYLESGFSSSLLADFNAFPVLLEVFLGLVGQSQYLADILTRDPQLLRWLTSTGELTRARSQEAFLTDARSATALFEKSERKLDALKRLHRREMLRIGARDILKEADVTTITGELSALADAIVTVVAEIAHHDLNARLGADLSNTMAVIGLGKLGGSELNFSSDIDLMFVYDADGDLKKPAGRLHSRHEYFVRLAEGIIAGLTSFTGEGYLYRVDMRLRPDGRSGPLAMSRAAMVSYYEARGADWERQMLIKARTVGGHRKVGDAFIADCRPFVFPRSILRSPWESIAAMKESIERESADESNIKLGAGGIRDIEFLVQGLQLLYGGEIPDLRTGNTLRALHVLAQGGIIPHEVHDQLRGAYELFRVIEHRLQLFHGQQTHQVPQTDPERQLLALKLGYGAVDEFDTILGRQRRLVRGHFHEFVRRGGGKTATAPGSPAIDLDALTAGIPSSLRPLAVDRIRAVMQEPKVMRTAELMLRQSTARTMLLKANVLSSVVAERLRSQPLLLDSLAGSGDALLRTSAPGWVFLRNSDRTTYHLYNETRSAIRFLTGATSVHKFSLELSTIAEQITADTAAEEWAQISGRKKPEGIVILALGKFGSRELTIWSDLDLVAIYNPTSVSSAKAQEFLQAFLRKTSRPSGSYVVDFRLRPEGRNAPLATSTVFFRDYLRDRAEIWELMSLTRARPVWGDASVWAQVRRDFRKRAGHLATPLGTYCSRMRSRMEKERSGTGIVDLKLGKGGMADLEFVIQGHALHTGTSANRPIDRMLDRTLADLRLPKSQRQEVRVAWTKLRTLEVFLRLNASTATSGVPPGQIVSDICAEGLGLRSTSELRRAIRLDMRTVRRVFIDSMRVLNGRSRRHR